MGESQPTPRRTGLLECKGWGISGQWGVGWVQGGVRGLREGEREMEGGYGGKGSRGMGGVRGKNIKAENIFFVVFFFSFFLFILFFIPGFYFGGR